MSIFKKIKEQKEQIVNLNNEIKELKGKKSDELESLQKELKDNEEIIKKAELEIANITKSVSAAPQPAVTDEEYKNALKELKEQGLI